MLIRETFSFSNSSLQRNPVCGFAFLGVDEVGVDLGGFDAPVGEHLGDRVDVRAECDLKRGKAFYILQT